MAQYRTCPYCGAHLDSGEKCDCMDEDENCGLPFQTVPDNAEGVENDV